MLRSSTLLLITLALATACPSDDVDTDGGQDGSSSGSGTSGGNGDTSTTNAETGSASATSGADGDGDSGSTAGDGSETSAGDTGSTGGDTDGTGDATGTTGDETGSTGADSSSTGAADPVCGNGIVEDGEACDDGQDNSDEQADACRTTCETASCGDGVTDTGEVCDDADANSDGTPDACRTTCIAPACGDGVVDSGEGCDEGPGGSAACDAQCNLLGSAANPAASCQAILDAGASQGTGAYTLDVGGNVQVLCDMTTDGGGWVMAYKISSNINPIDPHALWTGDAVRNEDDASYLDTASEDDHYMNRLVATLDGNSSFTQARVAVHDDTNGEQAFLTFDVPAASRTAWFAEANLTASTWTDITTEPGNFFSIAGDAGIGRRWFINRNYNGCPNDAGWLVVDATAAPCGWESSRAPALSILYPPQATFMNWNDAGIEEADVMIVWLR